MFREMRLRVRALWKRRQLDRDLRDELVYHMEQRQAGSPRAPFGNATRVQESMREVWSFTALEDLWRDVRHAFRTLRHAPGYTLAIIVLLAVGIGANAAIFSLIHPLLLERLPVNQPERLFILNAYDKEGRGPGTWGWSVPLYDAFEERFQSAELMASGGASNARSAAGLPAEDLDDLGATLVTGNYFQVLGIQARIGRTITPADDTFEDPHKVFVLSDAVWRSKLGGDPETIGREFTLFGTPFTLIGVMPPEFRGLGGDFWVPSNLQPLVQRTGDRRRDPNSAWLGVMGRLKPGVSMAHAQAEAEVVWKQLQDRIVLQANIKLDAGDRGFVQLRERFATPLWILMSAVGILLLITCANVASLLVARTGSRQREIAVRQAIGCGRARLLRQFLVESLLLAGCGGLVGLAVAAAGARGLVTMAAPNAIGAIQPGLDGNVVLFTLGVSVAAAILFGLAPAWRASRVSIETSLKNAARTSVGSPSRQLLNRSCLVVQAAFSVVLVAGAALFGQSLYRLYAFDPGFKRQQVITATVNARALEYQTNPDPGYSAAAERLVERLLAVPGVTSVSVTGTGFFTGSARTAGLVPEGHENRPRREPMRVNQATWSFLNTLGVPVLAGRTFSARDTADAPPVAVVNQAFVRRFYPTESPLGKRLWRGQDRTKGIEIVGVASDSKYNNLREEPVPMVYLPLPQDPRNFNDVQLRAEGPLAPLLPLVRQAILDVDPRLAPSRVETMDAALDRTVARDILLARLSGLFGFLALGVACFGVYGLISYVVASRTTEIGVRLAIGAQAGDVRRQVIGDALKTVAPGMALGIAGAVATERFIGSLLFGAKAHDPLTYGSVAACLLLSAAAAAYFPARRASRIDPAVALRCE